MIKIQMPSEAPHLHYSHSDSCGRTTDSNIVPAPEAAGTPTSQHQSMLSTSALPGACSASTAKGSNNGSSGGLNKRPKLSLQTSSLPMTFGKSTTALSLSLTTGPTSSPTVVNTFNNAFDQSRTDRSTSTSTSSLSTSIHRPRSSRHSSPFNGIQHLKSTNDDHPYRNPAGVRSILRNSPLPKSSLRQSSVAATGSSNGDTGRRALFPPKKQVRYNFPLEEEITTVTYVAKHSDILPTDSTSSSATTWSDGSSDEDDSAADSGSTPSDPETSPGSRQHSKRKRRKNSTGLSEKQIHAAALRDGLVVHGKEEEYGKATPQSPFLYGHRKRRREWRWTLGPLPTNEGQSSQKEQEDEVQAPQLPPPRPNTLEIPTLDTSMGATANATAAAIRPPSREDTDTDTDSIRTVASYLPLPDSLGSSPGVGTNSSFEELAMSPVHMS
ncbi:hypothetical protein FQN54_000293 [Arachnomyces sp. PD_36]|nr:hypothetical protein FQN54_000293 [Arachnomyces sp. PD_36]